MPFDEVFKGRYLYPRWGIKQNISHRNGPMCQQLSETSPCRAKVVKIKNTISLPFRKIVTPPPPTPPPPKVSLHDPKQTSVKVDCV